MPNPNQSFNIGLNSEQIKYFSYKVWKAMRVRSLADQLASSDGANVVHRVTEMKNTTHGMRAILTLVPDDTTFGVVGDNRLEDHEVGLGEHQMELTFDQLRKAIANEGRMADRSSWVDFTRTASEQLSWWAVDVKDRLMMNTLSGIDYSVELDGTARDSQFPQLTFAGDVSAPSANRHLRVDNDGSLTTIVGNAATSDITAADLPTWNTFTDLRTELPLMRVKPVRGKYGDGSDLYIVLVHPRTMGVLKKDPTFRENWKDSMPRSKDHLLFKGFDHVYIDGFLVISHRYVFSTLGAASGSKWGNGTVDGTRSLVLGAQALGLVEMSKPTWETETRDYKNSHALSLAIQFGFRKTVWPDQYANNSLEDFGVVALDHAIPTGATNYTL